MQTKPKASDVKKLQNLYSWAEFYATNQLWDQYEKTQGQIEVLTAKINPPC